MNLSRSSRRKTRNLYFPARSASSIVDALSTHRSICFILLQSVHKTTMAHNVQMPMFAAAASLSGSAGGAEAWNDVDHFDVDILAEYLLGDGTLQSGGIMFDFM
jgi:hypothetical protein